MSERVFYLDGLRTPFGSFKGVLNNFSATDLSSPLIKELLIRQELGPKSLSQLILGQVLQAGAGQAPARQAGLKAGLDVKTQALTLNKVCGSGLKALMVGASAIKLDEAGLVIAGGMESMSQAPHALRGGRGGLPAGDLTLVDLAFHDALTDPGTGEPMGLLVERRIAGGPISRSAQDEYAIRSYQLATQAQATGRFESEILPVQWVSKQGAQAVAEDEEPGRVNFDKIPQLKPVFDPQGSLTAANASSLNDGAAVCLLAGETEIKKRGLKPKAELLATAEVSLDPADFALAPIPAIQRVLEKAQVKRAQVDLFEINEAFAAVPLLALSGLGLDLRRLNVNGGAVSLGHPVGASGARICLTLVEELVLRKATYGVAAICIGGGEAVAALFRRVGDHEF